MYDWDNPISSNKEVMKLGRNSAAINCALFTRDGRYIVSGSDDGIIKLWFLEVRKETFILNEGTEDKIKILCFNNSDKYFVSAGNTKYLKLWD